MEFVVVARDEEGALPRRLKARERHIAVGDALAAQGILKFASA